MPVMFNLAVCLTIFITLNCILLFSLRTLNAICYSFLGFTESLIQELIVGTLI